MSHHLIPVGFLRDKAADLAIAAGKARRLAGLAIAFTGCLEAEDRDPRARLYRGIGDPGLDPAALDALSAPRADWAGFSFAKEKKLPLIMGVLNVTPDSFSDGGDHADIEAAIRHGRALAAAGADIIDVGGESTRPGAEPVSPAKEAARILPVIERLAAEGHVLSVDTRHGATMRRAIAAGARIVNDVTALTGDPEAPAILAESSAALLLMHMQGDPRTMQKAPYYRDVTLDLVDYFSARIEALTKIGIDRRRIAIDPGIGFGKKDRHNLQLIAELAALQIFGLPIAIGLSRKSLIGRLSRGEAPKDRVAGSLALGLTAAAAGALILRVHDVAATYQARALWRAGALAAADAEN